MVNRTVQPWVRALLVCGVLGVIACGDDGVTDSPDASMSEGCTRDVECDDGLFCNGTEQCMPEAGDADANGCVSGTAPCEGSCNEAEDRCLEGCLDADGDGHADVACGGDDCDDADSGRYPTNPEVCDSEGQDEDCDPTTFGDDADGDGFVDDACCNTQADGGLLCGTDCDDGSMAINPDAVDTCGNGDENCNGDIDDDPDLRFYRDLDDDTYGLEGDSILACSAPVGYAVRSGDCDDANDTVNPGATELCDAAMRDEDCDGAMNEDCGCAPTGTSRVCGSTDVGECSLGTQTCLPSGDGGSVWGPCDGDVTPVAESCNALDDDCDGVPDNGFDCVRGTVESGTNTCGRAASRTCDSTCVWNPPTFGIPETGATCDYCDDSGLGLSQEIPNATSMVSWTFDTEPITKYGSALGALCTGTCIHLTRTTGDPGVEGSAYYTAPVQVGYGSIVYDVTTQVRPNQDLGSVPIGDGWALVMFDAATGSELLGPGGLALGVPTDRDGFAVEWRFAEPNGNNRQTTDSLVLRHLRATASDPVVTSTLSVQPQVFDSTSSTLKWFQRLRLTLSPDIPGDATNDTELLVEYYAGGVWQSAFSCGAGSACPFAIEAASDLRVGVTGASRTGYEARMFVDVTSSLQVNGLCP